jgi:hypothetical protein
MNAPGGPGDECRTKTLQLVNRIIEQLLVGGGTKVVYDLLLYRSFRRLKPPEEVH